MGRYPVTVRGESEPAFVARSAGSRVMLTLGTGKPKEFSVEDAEYIRAVIGFAIADAQAINAAQADHVQHRGSSSGGDDHV